jgi:hypothetical protein
MIYLTRSCSGLLHGSKYLTVFPHPSPLLYDGRRAALSDGRGRWRIAGAIAGGVFIAAMAFLLPARHTATSNGGQQYAEPLQIAGNLYYVGRKRYRRLPAHQTPGPCTSRWRIRRLQWMKFTDPQRYPGIRQAFEHTIETLRSLSPDILVTSHARAFGRYRKFSARASANDPVDPFIDRAGYVE